MLFWIPLGQGGKGMSLSCALTTGLLFESGCGGGSQCCQYVLGPSGLGV